jgi:hypothetical protein
MLLEIAIWFRSALFIVLIVLGGSLCAPDLAHAQRLLTQSLPQAKTEATDAPKSVEATPPSSPAIPPTTPAAPPHAFWDSTNLMLFSGIAATRAMDYFSTRNFQARGRQEILVPDDVVNNSAGFASLEAAATATSVGISYWLHRTGHHKLERWISIGHIGVTGFGVIRNYSLESRHTTPTHKSNAEER